MSDTEPGATEFLDADEREIARRFAAEGRIVAPAEDQAALDRIRGEIAALAAGHLGLPAPHDPAPFLEAVHERVGPDALNGLRLAVLGGMAARPWLRPAYFRLARRTLERVVGNELAMQRRINLSVQLPGDDSSLLPLHSDVWSGDSPFEMVLWVPLVDCRGTMSMFLLPPAPSAALQDRFPSFAGRPVEAIYDDVAADLEWVEMRYGEVMLFNQCLPHGNRVNGETATRWSMNCRFKGVFTPYADKRLGEFFEPVTLRPASRIGLDYRLPAGRP